MVRQVPQCGDQPKEQKKAGYISNQTAIVHIVISVMYFVDTVIPIADTFPCKDITVVLGLNTLIALLTGIIGFRASKRPSIPLSKVYIGLSVLSGVGALCLLVVAIIRFFISSCGQTNSFISATVITLYSTVSALFEIPNCIVSVSVFNKVVNRLKQERATQNADEFVKLEEKRQPSNSKYEYSTIGDNLPSNNQKNTDGHPYQETLQGALVEDNENGFKSHHFYPTVIVTSQQSQEVSPERQLDETTYIEMDDKMTSNLKFPGKVTTFVYDYTYADVAPEPPPRAKRSSEVLKSFTLPHPYLEIYDKSDPPKKYAHSADMEHARERRQTYFHKKFASRFQPLADDQPTSGVFLAKVNKYHNAFADRLRCAVSNEEIYPVANQSPLKDESEKKVGEPFPRPKRTDQHEHFHSVNGQSCLSDVESTDECTSSNTEPVQKNWGLYGDCGANSGGIVKSMQQRTTGECQLPFSSLQESMVGDETTKKTSLKSRNNSGDDVGCLVVNESYSYLHEC
ncbi:uncharacterized protein LOC117102467 [Anneissia japonica]|uniref:uncharacterized protein LOC117102467 n=1 Tax=Anneissia japonica TaxID=1529436 RepID=UPI0014257927|nr:uncharacterized protein LOC117102467 [Anneissia japonica]